MQCVAGDSLLSISEDADQQEGRLCMSLTTGIVLRKVFIVLTTVLYRVFCIFLSGVVLWDVCEEGNAARSIRDRQRCEHAQSGRVQMHPLQQSFDEAYNS